MSKLIVTRGLPASGKSTWAVSQVEKDKTHKTIRVNRDAIRLMLHGKSFIPAFEDYVTSLRDNNITRMLAAGFTVINDDTNLSHKRMEQLRTMAMATGADFEVNSDFLSVSVETCVKRDAQRTNSVGKDVIERMYYDYWAQYTPPVNKGEEYAIICDMDGTLATIPPGANKYDRDFTKDILNDHIRSLVFASHVTGTHTIIMSGRDERAREQTESWLKTYDIPYEMLLMRTEEEMRNRVKDTEVKKRLYLENVQGKYKVLYVVDDRPSVVRMWRAELGLTVLQCGPNMEF